MDDIRSMDGVWMEQALRLAEEALAEDQLPVGVVVVMDGKMIGSGRRLYDMDTRLDHGEIQALRCVMKTLGGYYKEASRACLYTTLEPCIMCMGTILNCRIGRVVYAMEDPYGGAANIIHVPILMPPRHQTELPVVISGIRREEARDLLKAFFMTTRNAFWKKPDNPLFQICVEESI